MLARFAGPLASLLDLRDGVREATEEEIAEAFAEEERPASGDGVARHPDLDGGRGPDDASAGATSFAAPASIAGGEGEGEGEGGAVRSASSSRKQAAAPATNELVDVPLDDAPAWPRAEPEVPRRAEPAISDRAEISDRDGRNGHDPASHAVSAASRTASTSAAASETRSATPRIVSFAPARPTSPPALEARPVSPFGDRRLGALDAATAARLMDADAAVRGDLDGAVERMLAPLMEADDDSTAAGAAGATSAAALAAAAEREAALLETVRTLETELSLRRAESMMLRAGSSRAFSPPIRHQRAAASPAPRTPQLATPPTGVGNEDEDGRVAVVRHCADVVKRLCAPVADAAPLATKADLVARSRTAGAAIVNLAARLATAELRAAEAEKRAGCAEAELGAVRSVVVSCLERGARKDTVEVVARVLRLSADERKRVGLDGGGARHLDSFLSSVSEFVRDETS